MSGLVRIGCLVMAGVAVMAVLPFAGALLESTPMVAGASAGGAGTLDVPADVLGAIQSAARQSGVPWVLLAGVASVATDFARHAPDGQPRAMPPPGPSSPS